ncbi:hypothetical protein [Methylobacterium gnaphalii]|uniref:Uncharacterized protein n=1 Tax=Methylobacterium gnaphalii TaxID=1010610 RepID=A0A512JR44_9HYPH|nr:hypothetical protein [Methylobacterium gnaphalii]GEP12427.1 hypothetical protein MGN01_42720 [Methylobacterium gnaphalii]GJD71758.1 hypothetical protein MMMDOFMJ_4723 [Methylobacterium gnaphalii]GLS48855.1 hypothetical protein GCM10007885_17020 [Methylobacterium gnaphalii]
MSGNKHLPQLAMVVVPSKPVREAACRKLAASGFDTVGFSDCENAAAWLEEETPVIAIVATGASGDCKAFLSELRERGSDIEEC